MTFVLCLLDQARHESTDCGLKQVLAEIIPEKQKQVKEFRAKHGGFVVGDVTIDMVSCFFYSSSVEDALEVPGIEGVKFSIVLIYICSLIS